MAKLSDRTPHRRRTRDIRDFQTHAEFDTAGVVDGWGIGAVPDHCPYRPGQWVVLHGYPGYDGREWCEQWGWLDPDGTADYDDRCSCHPHPKRYRPRPARYEQLALLAVA